MKNTAVKSVVVLFSICLVVSAILAAVNFITAPIIKKSEKEAAQKALLVVMPEGKNFTEFDYSGFTLPSGVTNVYKDEGGGFVFRIVTTGYSSGMTLMCGISPEGKITGATCVSSNETLGAEKLYGSCFVGATRENIGAVDALAGSTARLTMNAYKNAMKDALEAFEILKGAD